ncbi:acyl carrier protein [Streptacidiphilus sp. ASG 303]|uniref:acyl carrier protein n=1 Tax=Streptacidiphilus sp. ASG 303 TaxID=2896847 RepID=UPI001E318798|nr:acyl carrier protein [Streptacidiphilus sp. ASG 303]MCD0484165.1 acyl carrier protein [Streptacidiphilus sp. ASG 303]
MNDVYGRLVKLLVSGFGLEPKEIAPDDTFSGLELDSLALVELSIAAQEEFGVPISDDDLGPNDTVAHAAEVIAGKAVAA